MKKIQKNAKHGDKRIVRIFLLFPKRIGDETRWLRFAKIRQKYSSVDGLFYNYDEWVDVAWEK